MTDQAEVLRQAIDPFWEREILPALEDYIRIPNLSVDFDPQWQSHGHMERARTLALDWLRAHAPDHWTVHSPTLPGRTPLILVDIPGDCEATVLIYGHLDKQPEMEGWSEGLGPWEPVRREERLYGRGGADDGYALFAAVAAVRALDQQGAAHPRIVLLVEFSEESGSPDLPAYLEAHGALIGQPDLVIALDSGAGDYQRLWSTTSLRGVLSCNLTVQVLEEGVHSGLASGLIPSSMDVMRCLLDRLQDPATGAVRLQALQAAVPDQRREQARRAADILGGSIIETLPTVAGLRGLTQDPAEGVLNSTWRPTLSVTGQDGLPPVGSAGNVLRPHTTLKLSFRLPPTVDWRAAREAIRGVLTRDPPHGARVEATFDHGGNGWDAPALAPWLARATDEASRTFYGREAAYVGLGGSIPFMAMLGERFPEAQFLITGVLGPHSNAHGPNEFLHIPYAKRLTACIAHIVARHPAVDGPAP